MTSTSVGNSGSGQVARAAGSPYLPTGRSIEYQDDRLDLRRHRQQANDSGEQQIPLRVRLGGLRRREVGDSASQRWGQPAQLGAVGIHVGQEQSSVAWVT